MAHRTSVVTGGAGFIGSHLVDRLLAEGDQVVVVDDLSNGRREQVAQAAHLETVDVVDAARLVEIARAHKPRRWFHLAAQASVTASVREPLHDASVNVLGTVAVLLAARETGAPVIFSSTGGALYGAAAPRPTEESAATEPLSPYAASKLSAEAFVGMDSRLHSTPHVTLRYSNVYGPRQDPHGEAGVVAIFCGRILEGQDATIFGDGEQTRDYVYVDDVVDATYRAGEQALVATPPAGAAINVGSGVETSVNELWQELARISGSQVQARNAPPRAGELMHSSLSPRRAEQLLGWTPQVSVSEGLARTYEWFRNRATPDNQA